MKYEFHAGDYIESFDGSVGYLTKVEIWYSGTVGNDVVHLQGSTTVDASCGFTPFTITIPLSDISKYFNRIGQCDFTKTESKSIERLPVDLVARFEVPDGRYITTKTWDKDGKFVEASYSRELIDKINELINVVNELQEDYNTHLEAHKQNER